MDYGICLPNFPEGASAEGIEAAAEIAERLRWSTVWTTDHVLVPTSAAAEYGRIYEAILTLAWIGARHPTLKLGTSVIVVPQRNAIVLAKELASLDALSGGRVVAGVGVGWNEPEFANLGVAERFHVRGAYLDETIRLWRHLWSGSTQPFRGRFHDIDDFAFAPLPVQGEKLPILVGGRSDAAVARAGSLGDGYHSSAIGPDAYRPRAQKALEAARRAGRTISLSARVQVRLGEKAGPGEKAGRSSYAMRGTPEQVAAEVRAWTDVGVTHLALAFSKTTPDEVVRTAEAFGREVAPLV